MPKLHQLRPLSPVQSLTGPGLVCDALATISSPGSRTIACLGQYVMPLPSSSRAITTHRYRVLRLEEVQTHHNQRQLWAHAGLISADPSVPARGAATFFIVLLVYLGASDHPSTSAPSQVL